MQVRDERVVRPDGNEGAYAYVHFKNVAVGVLPLTEAGEAILVGQWRYTLEAYSWEIPAGGCLIESGESPLDTARRELAEETGMAAEEIVDLGRGHLSNSISDEVSAMFLARGLTPIPEGPRPEPTEELAVRRFPFAELLAMIHRGEITDALTLTTVLRYQLRSGAAIR